MSTDDQAAPAEQPAAQPGQPVPDGWGVRCSIQFPHGLTECNGYHVDLSDT